MVFGVHNNSGDTLQLVYSPSTNSWSRTSAHPGERTGRGVSSASTEKLAFMAFMELHSLCPCTRAELGTMLCKFLDENPSETVTISTKQEDTDDGNIWKPFMSAITPDIHYCTSFFFGIPVSTWPGGQDSRISIGNGQVVRVQDFYDPGPKDYATGGECIPGVNDYVFNAFSNRGPGTMPPPPGFSSFPGIITMDFPDHPGDQLISAIIGQNFPSSNTLLICLH
ncbi:hypothetical protein L208DRAFT_1376938 [Tricholoma matsutake]|nr:hypothetical protein L208DRAFT_1376938 [Tricholoma matsutake 945]